MNKSISTSIKEILKEFRQGILAAIAVLVVASTLALLKSVRNLVYDLLQMPTTIGALLLLSALFFLLGKQIGKKKDIKKIPEVTQQNLIQYGYLKWDITVYSNGHFEVAPMPYCSSHDMRLVEQWPLYFCPRFGECNSQISYREIPVAKAQVESYIESEIRKRNT